MPLKTCRIHQTLTSNQKRKFALREKKRLYSRKSTLIDKTYNYSDSLVVHNEMKFCIRDRDTDKDIYGQSCAQIPLSQLTSISESPPETVYL